MKSLKTLAILAALVFAAAAVLTAGEWRVSATFGARPVQGGHFSGGHGGRWAGGYGPWRPPMRSWYPAHPAASTWGYGSASWVYYSSDSGWNVGWSSGYPVSGWWHPSWGAPVYVVRPWPVSTYTVFLGGAYANEWADDAAPAPRGDGVFMAAVNAPAPKSGALDGVREPMAQPHAAETDAWAAPAPPRRDLEPVARIFRTGAVERAEAELGKLLRERPSDAVLSYNYAWVLLLREKYATSAWCLRRAMVLDAAVGRSGGAGVSGFYEAKSSAAAVERLKTWLASRPDDVSARLAYGWALIIRGDAMAARAELEKVLAASPEDAQAKALLDICPKPDPAAPAAE